MAKNELSVETYLLQGRITKSVFARHRLKENIEEFKARIILSLEKLKIAFFMKLMSSGRRLVGLGHKP